MMRALPLLLALSLLAPLAPGASDGRSGVDALGVGSPVEAVAAFQTGLAQSGVPRWAEARLWYDLGLAHARTGNDAQADTALGRAVPLQDDPAARARYAAAAGTAALAVGDAPRAVGLLRRALLLAPDDASYRRTYEIARRRAQGEEPPGLPEPSDFARRLKERAERLVGERRYGDALALMQDGLRQDSTVAAYAEWTARLGGVAEIEVTQGAPDTSGGAPPVPRPR